MQFMPPLYFPGLARAAVLVLGWALASGSSIAQQCLTQETSPSAPVRKLFIVAGQSNAVGLASVKDIEDGPDDYVQRNTVFPNVKIYGIYGAPPGVVGNDDAVLSRGVQWSRFASWKIAQPGFGYKNVTAIPKEFPADITAKEMFGPELYLARFLNDSPPYDHYIVKLAISNTSLNSMVGADHWAPGGHLYEELLKMIANAHNSKESKVKLQVAGLFFMQGETDALNEAWAKKYKENLKNFVIQFRKSMVRMKCAKDGNAPVVLGRIQDNSVWTYRTYIRTAQEQVARELPHVGLIDTDDFSRHLVAGGVHFNEYGQAHLGERVYKAFFALSGCAGKSSCL